MGNINILDITLANLIAAGEVVDRPASAIKELLENAIDACATQITVEIKNGGSSLMRVTDNGHGMDRQDVINCVKRHATSKVRTASDLDGILTLGFRGEALAAISSVSEFRIISRKDENEEGTLLRISEGNVVQCEAISCPVGTTVIVEALFANIPARRKFLKKDITETGAIVAVVEKQAMAHPDIAIKLIADEKIKFQTPGSGNLRHTIHAVLGRDFASKLVEVDDETEGIRVCGFIGRSDNVHATRGKQNFFINGRYVKTSTGCAALEQAFVSYCPPDKYPCCILDIRMHPVMVDVNVHPAKLEVKFANEKIVFHAIYCAVRNALSGAMSRPQVRPDLHMTGDDLRALGDLIAFKAESAQAATQIAMESERLHVPYRQISAFDAPQDTPAQRSTQTIEVEGESTEIAPPPPPRVSDRIAEIRTEEQALARKDITVSPIEPLEPAPKPRSVAPSPKETPPDPLSPPVREQSKEKKPLPLPEYRLEGVLFSCYIVVETEGKMLLIDKHAAHERILFEQFKANMEKMDSCPQMMLFPITLHLSSLEFAAAFEFMQEIVAIGFDYTKGEEDGTLNLIQIPSEIDRSRAAEVFSALCATLAEGATTAQQARQALLEKALFQASCKAAVKAGKPDDTAHLRYITEQVLTRPEIRFCPHGRPVALEMTQHQVEHLFHRT